MYDYSLLANRLNRHKTLARFLLMLPAFIALIYVYFFGRDTINVYGTIDYNNKVIENSEKFLVEVYDYETTDEGYNIITVPTVDIITKPSDENIMYVSFKDNKLYYTLYEDTNKSVERISSLLFDTFIEENGTYTVVLNDKDFTEIKNIPSDTFAFLITVTSEGNYKLTYLLDDTIADKIYYAIDGLNYDGETEEYIISNSYYYAVTDITDSYPCTELPTNHMYYDIESQQLLQNISSNFVWSYLLGTKIYFVFVMILVILILFTVIKNKESFELDINTKPYTILNNVMLIVVFLFGLVAWLLLHV